MRRLNGKVRGGGMVSVSFSVSVRARSRVSVMVSVSVRILPGPVLRIGGCRAEGVGRVTILV